MVKEITEKQKNKIERMKDEEKVKLKFKKKGFKKLLLFDLDETLIHVKRTEFEEGDI